MTIPRSQFFQLLRAVGGDGWVLYTVMMAYSKDSVCYATQQQLMDALDISKTTVNSRLRKLRENGLIGRKTKSGYGLTMPTGFEISDSHVLNTSTASSTSSTTNTSDTLDDGDGSIHIRDGRTAMLYWLQQYQTAYGVEYHPTNWGRETVQMKSLLSRYEPRTLEAIIDVVMRLYVKKWSSQRFTRPTVGALTSWMAAQAEPFASANLAGAEQSELDLEETSDGETLADEFESKGWI